MTTETYAPTPMTAYGVVHYLLRKQRGPARNHPCVGCGQPARQWAYDHKDVFERVDPATEPPMLFSVNFDHYQPMCPPCHQRIDSDRAAIGGWR